MTLVLKDLARTATIAAKVHIPPALDPSQAQDDPVFEDGRKFKLSHYPFGSFFMKSVRINVLSFK